MSHQSRAFADVPAQLVDQAIRMVEPGLLTDWLREEELSALPNVVPLLGRLAQTTGMPRYRQQTQYYADRLASIATSSTKRSSRELMDFAQALRQADQGLGTTGYEEPVRRALQVGTAHATTNAYSSNSFATGRAGLVMALLQAYEYYKDAELLTTLGKVLERLVDDIELGRTGIYWDNGRNGAGFPYGFSHGNSGIGWVLAALGAYFNSEALESLARETFRYEDAHFSQPAGNWPDWTKPVTSAEQQEAYVAQYRAQNWAFFNENYANLTFETGLVGMLWARLAVPRRSYEQSDQKQPVDVALAHLPVILALPHRLAGLDGVTRVFLHQLCETYIPECGAVSADLLLNYLTTQHTPTVPLVQALYAGLGHGVDSLLLPRLLATFPGDQGQLPPLLRTSVTQLADRLSRRHFPRTTAVLDYLNPAGWTTRVGLANPLDAVRSRADWPAMIPDEQRPYVADVMQFEEQLLAKQQSTANRTLVYVAEVIGFARAKDLLQQADEALMDGYYQLASDVTLVETNWNWLNNEDCSGPEAVLSRIGAPPDPSDWALKTTSDKLQRIATYPLQGFDSLLLEFVQPVRPRELIDQLCQMDDLLAVNGAAFIHDVILAKIKFFINEALIEPATSYKIALEGQSIFPSGPSA